MTKIVSPVAQYIHNTNVPKLLRNIRYKHLHNPVSPVEVIIKYDCICLLASRIRICTSRTIKICCIIFGRIFLFYKIVFCRTYA